MIIGPIIGVDPGTTTGVAVWSPQKNALDWADELPARDAVRVIWRLLDTYDSDREPQIKVACERYDITPETIRKTRNYDALHVTGAVRFKVELLLLSAEHTERFAFAQHARSDAKHFASNDRLRTLGWYRRGKPHANDATRQLLMTAVELDPVLARAVQHRGHT